MEQNFTVNILLPTYNGETYIEDQIKSILNQSYANFQLLIRDDGSKDKTLDIVKKIAQSDKRIKLMTDNRGNLGLVKSIERLLTMANADLIFFADQDDYWIENKIEVFFKHYTSMDIPILVHSNSYVTDNELRVRGLFLNKVSENIGLKDSLFKYFVQGSSSMINNKLKNLLLPFPDDVYVHDRYFHIISEIVGKRIYIEQPTMYYRQHVNNLIGSKSLIQKIKSNLKLKKFYLEEDKKLLEKLSEKFPENTLLKVYCTLTCDKVSRFQKLRLLKSNTISTRLKEKILLLLNN